MKLQIPQVEDFNFEMTPMIDVVFLLVAFFMTVASFDVHDKVTVDMPIAPQATVPEETRGRQTISVNANGDFFIGSRPSTIEEVKAAIDARATEDGEAFKGVYLRIDAKTPYRYTSEAMKACAEVGVFNVIFGVEQKKSASGPLTNGGGL